MTTPSDDNLNDVRDGSSAPAKPILKVVTPGAPPPPSGWLSGVSPNTIAFPFAFFKKLTYAIPHYMPTLDWTGVVSTLAPDPAPVVAAKSDVEYFMAAELRSAPLVSKTLEWAKKHNMPLVGVQRSASHVVMNGPAVVADVDAVDVFSLEPRVRALGPAAVIFSSYSYGSQRPDDTIKLSGRIVIAGDRQWLPAEHKHVMAAMDDLLGGHIDANAKGYWQCMGVHATFSGGQPKRVIIDGETISIDKLVARGKELVPPEPDPKELTPRELRRRKWQDELALKGVPAVDFTAFVSATRYLLAAGYFDTKEKTGAEGRYKEFIQFLYVAAFIIVETSALQSRVIELIEEVVRGSGRELGKTFGSHEEQTGGWFDRAIDKARTGKLDNGRGTFFGAARHAEWAGQEDGLRWRAKRRAEGILEALYPRSKPTNVVVLFKGIDVAKANAEMSAGFADAPDKLDPNKLTRDDAVWAVDFLMSVFRHDFKSKRARWDIPDDVDDEATQRSTKRDEEEALAGRLAMGWDAARPAAEQTTELARLIVQAGAPVFVMGDTLVMVTPPTENEQSRQTCRRAHGYDGPPTGPEDPSNYLGVRIEPVVMQKRAMFRTLLSQYVVRKCRKLENEKDPNSWVTYFMDFKFKDGSKDSGPDDGVLQMLIARSLPLAARKLHRLVTAPTIAAPPAHPSIEHLLDPEADRIIDKPGYDTKSMIFYAPEGSPVVVPDRVPREEALVMLEQIKKPFGQFPFTSTVEGVSSEVGRAVACGMSIAGVVRAGMELCPGLAVSTPPDSQGTGKTWLAQCVAAPGYGGFPSVRTLPTELVEQEKTVTTALRGGARALLFDNVPTNLRWDNSTLAAAMTSDEYTSRTFGLLEEITVSTRTLILVTGCGLNTTGDMASRNLMIELDAGMERPDERTGFKIESLKRHMAENRQRTVAACLGVLRAYIQHCREIKKIPDEVMAKRAKGAIRFPSVSVIRDALLWLGMEDMLLSADASKSRSGSRARNADLLHRLLKVMVHLCGYSPTAKALLDDGRPALPPSSTHPNGRAAVAASPERQQFDIDFDTIWNSIIAMGPAAGDYLLGQFGVTTVDREKVKHVMLNRAIDRANVNHWSPKIHAGVRKFSASDLIGGLTGGLTGSATSDQLQLQHSDYGVFAEVVSAGRKTRLTQTSLGVFLSRRLNGAIVDGLQLKSEEVHNSQRYWVRSV